MRVLCMALVGVVCLVGCSSKPARIMPPSIDAKQAGLDAIKEYDANGDGLIGGEELDKAASIKAGLAKIDTNSDKQVSADEITARINAWKESKVGIMSLACRVSLDGKPAEGATVTFVPEAFLGPAVKPCKGVVSPQGMAMLSVDDEDLKKRRISGAQTGFYKVEISGGKRPVPAKYGSSSPIGEEVAQDASWSQRGGPQFDLRSK